MIVACKLDGVGPIDNIPCTNKLHHFVKKKKIKNKKYNWQLTCDMWHVTCIMWHMVGGEHSLKISAPQLLWFGINSTLKIL